MNESKRKFLGYSVAFAAATFLRNVEVAAAPEKPQTTIKDILWLHDTPTGGGSMDPPRAFKDADRVNANGFVVLEPSNEWLAEYKKHPEKQFISRAFLKDNDYSDPSNQQKLNRLANRIRNAGIKDAIVQPFNEVNRPHAETDNQDVSPQLHVTRDLLPAADSLEKFGFKTLITPLAQNSPIEDEEYLTQMLGEIKKQKSSDWINKNLVLGLHAYALYPGDNPMTRIQRLHDKVKQVFGFQLDIHVTEGGLHQNEETNYDDETVALETDRLRRIVLPPNLPIKSYALWLYANFAQRPAIHQEIEKDNAEVQSYEKSALIRSQGETVVFQRLAAN